VQAAVAWKSYLARGTLAVSLDGALAVRWQAQSDCCAGWRARESSGLDGVLPGSYRYSSGGRRAARRSASCTSTSRRGRGMEYPASPVPRCLSQPPFCSAFVRVSQRKRVSRASSSFADDASFPARHQRFHFQIWRETKSATCLSRASTVFGRRGGRGARALALPCAAGRGGDPPPRK
jgi:hypothetical protein